MSKIITTDEIKPGPRTPDASGATPQSPEAQLDQKQNEGNARVGLPGVAAIALWLLLEALIGVMGVFTNHFAGRSTRNTVLAMATLFAIASLGLLRLKRWGWALALAAAFLTSSYGIYCIMRYHESNFWLLTLVNFVFFFYLIRPAVLRRLR